MNNNGRCICYHKKGLKTVFSTVKFSQKVRFRCVFHSCRGKKHTFYHAQSLYFTFAVLYKVRFRTCFRVLWRCFGHILQISAQISEKNVNSRFSCFSLSLLSLISRLPFIYWRFGRDRESDSCVIDKGSLSLSKK